MNHSKPVIVKTLEVLMGEKAFEDKRGKSALHGSFFKASGPQGQKTKHPFSDMV